MSKKTSLRYYVLLVVVAFLFIASYVPVWTASASSSSFAFSDYELSQTPGVTCPNNQGTCTNPAAEPQILSAPNGYFYASSENGLGSGTEAWISTDGGMKFNALTSPNSNSTGVGHFGPGGGDTDLATATVKNSQGNYNVYVESLSLADVTVSTSTNNGKSWSLDITSASVPVDDRPWIAADGASKVCISYHDIATFNIDVNCSNDAGATFTQVGDAIDTAHLWLINNNEIGNLVFDHKSHNLYQIFSGIANSNQVKCGEEGTCGYNTVWIGVSTNGGKNFTDYDVYTNPNNQTSYGHQFVNLAVDYSGNLYAVFSDNHNVYYSFSTNQGVSWSHPRKVNLVPSRTAIMPWSSAGKAGEIDIVWYGTAYYNKSEVPDNYPMSAAWHVFFAQSLNALSTSANFTQVSATPVVHYGGVCESGVTCTGNRDLYDDFGVFASPKTGLAVIVFSDDHYSNTMRNPANCFANQTNTVNCDHTSISQQTSGSGI